MKPTYTFTKPSSRIFVGDCRDVVPDICGDVADLVIADPPYNMNRCYDGMSDRVSRTDYEQFTRQWIRRVVSYQMTLGSSLFVVIPFRWTPLVYTLCVDYLKMDFVQDIIWHYRFGVNGKRKFVPSHTHILWFSIGRHRFNPIEVAVESDRASKYNDKRTLVKKDGMPPGKRVPLDVWTDFARVQGTNAERRPMHDNQLPELLVARIIKAASNKGDLVLDPFLGSGTTGVVARALGRRFVGIEQSAKYAKSAAARMREGPVRHLNEKEVGCG